MMFFGRRTILGVFATGFALSLVLVFSPGSANAQSADTAMAIPGPQYAHSGLYQTFMGSGYRDLWTAPMAVEVADLGQLGGGLTPFRLGGGTTTRTLHLRGADGRRYVFRSVDKSPDVLAEELAGTPVERVLQDQISSFHPSAALIVPPLLDAIGVLHAEPQLFLIPDDPRLGEFREDFAGLLALFEERPDDGPDGTAGFAGSTRIEGTDELFDILEEDSRNKVAAEELLRSRLVSLLIGDRDRSKNNFLWARFDDPAGGFIWRPIPRDRDQALVQFDGVFKSLARTRDPRLVMFEANFPPITALTRNAWDVDRTFLVTLDREAWGRALDDVRTALTEAVLRDAVRRLPPVHYALGGADIETELISRLGQLDEAAWDLYDIVFSVADVHASDDDDIARVEGLGQGRLRLSLFTADDQDGAPYFDRIFDGGETSEVRLYMHGGEDRVEVSGNRDEIVLRVVGGGDHDRLVDSSSSGSARTDFYDGGNRTEFVTGRHTAVHHSNPPRPRSWWDDERSLDWGTEKRLLPAIAYDSNRGLTLGAGLRYDRFGFNKQPYSSRAFWQAGWAFGAEEPDLVYRHHILDPWDGVDVRFSAEWSGLEVINFFGLGNNSEPVGDNEFHEVDQRLATVGLAFEIGDGEGWWVGLGPEFRHASSDTTDMDHFVATERPYGSGTFAQLGLSTVAAVDRRDRPVNSSSGFRGTLRGRVFPGILSLDEGAFGDLRGELSGYLSPSGANPTLAVRVGGQKLWGSFPYYEAAYIGGGESVRGLRDQRYGGEAAVFANSELRVDLGSFLFVLPIDFGIFGLADVGRVFRTGESSSTWHRGVGGGVSFTPFLLSTTLRFAWARSEGASAYYLDLGGVF